MEIEYSPGLVKQYKKAPKKVQEAFKQRLLLFAKKSDHTLLHNHALKGRYGRYRSINVTGDWRAIYEEIGKVAYFVALGTHSQLYG